MVMRKLMSIRVDPRYMDRVHLMNPDGTGSMCNGLHLNKTRGEVTVPNAFEVGQSKPATCRQCLKALEMLIRTEINGMDGPALEKVHTLVVDLRLNGAVDGLRERLSV